MHAYTVAGSLSHYLPPWKDFNEIMRNVLQVTDPPCVPVNIRIHLHLLLRAGGFRRHLVRGALQSPPSSKIKILRCKKRVQILDPNKETCPFYERIEVEVFILLPILKLWNKWLLLDIVHLNRRTCVFHISLQQSLDDFLLITEPRMPKALLRRGSDFLSLYKHHLD